MHGGRVRSDRRGWDRGAAFVRLPVVGKTAEARSGGHAGRTCHPVAGKRVLVVDDNRDAADSLGMFLKILGATVEVGFDGMVAMERLNGFGRGSCCSTSACRSRTVTKSR